MRVEVENLPELFLERMRLVFPQNRYHGLINTFAFKKPVSLRINTGRISVLEAKETFAKNRVRLFPVSWYQEAFTTNYPYQKITKLPLFKNGEIYLQRLSSMIPALVLRPKKGEMVLDMAAAPGSKTLQMANLMQNQGLITAVDKDKIRVERLLFNIERQRAKNVVVKMADATTLWKEYPCYFDKILLDAPCSSEGRFYVHDQSTYKHYSDDFIAHLSHLQKKLIASGLVSLKVGGELVYSTCTFAPEENEGVINWVVEMLGDRVEIVETGIRLSNLGPPVLKWKGKSFAKKVSLARRILPDRYMEGFFVCKMRKVKEIKL